MGFVTGTIHYISLMYWLSHTMKTYGDMPYYLCIPILILLSMYLGCYLAVFSSMANILTKYYNLKYILFILPVLWVSLEYIRSFLFTGFPWALLGHSQYNRLHLIQISDILGTYGVSFIIVLINVTFFFVYLYITTGNWQDRRIGKGLIPFAVFISLVFVCSTIYYGKYRIGRVERSYTGSKSVAIVQGNIEQSEKWDPQFKAATTKKYIDLSASSKNDSPELIVWPETSAPFYFLHDKKLTQFIKEGVRETGTFFLIGSPSYKTKNKAIVYHNSAYLINPEGKTTGKYDKVHLVPFGEYVPLKKWVPFIGKMVEHVGDFSSGEAGKTLSMNDTVLGVQICYEIIFPNLSRKMTANGTQLLINITNDAWYGKTSAPYQHFSMAVFRAVENKRSLVRSANTGISGFIDPVGNILGSTQLFVDAVMTKSVPIANEITLYTRYGDIFAKCCMLITAFTLININYRRKNHVFGT